MLHSSLVNNRSRTNEGRDRDKQQLLFQTFERSISRQSRAQGVSSSNPSSINSGYAVGTDLSRKKSDWQHGETLIRWNSSRVGPGQGK